LEEIFFYSGDFPTLIIEVNSYTKEKRKYEREYSFYYILCRDVTEFSMEKCKKTETYEYDNTS